MLIALPLVNPYSAAKPLRFTWYSWMAFWGIVVTRYCPVPYSFSPPSMVDRLLRPLLPPIENPVVPKPVNPGFWLLGESALATPGSVYTCAVMLWLMLGSSWTWS